MRKPDTPGHPPARGPERIPATDEAVDPVVAKALKALDPARTDPNFWARFRMEVLSRAAPELARRRAGELSVPEVLSGWARTLLPATLLAAALAGLLMARQGPSHNPPPLTVDEILVQELGDDPIPTALGAADTGSRVAFAAERF